VKRIAVVTALAAVFAGKAEKVHAHALPSSWLQGALCVHSKEGSWTDAGAPFYGGMQFLLSTWRAAGGLRYASYPHWATPHEQLHVAYNLWRRAGWNPWPNTARACGLL
jgi:hypothetical protein